MWKSCFCTHTPSLPEDTGFRGPLLGCVGRDIVGVEAEKRGEALERRRIKGHTKEVERMIRNREEKK